MKKKIRGFGTSIIKAILGCWVLAIIPGFFFVLFLQAKFYGISIIFSILSLFFIICGFVPYFMLPAITFCENNICFPMIEKILVDGKYTYKNKIRYSKIDDVRLIQSYKKADKTLIANANRNQTKGLSLYLEFIINGEESKWFNISFYSEKQRVKIINLINAKTGLSKSYNQLVRELLAPQIDGKIDLK